MRKVKIRITSMNTLKIITKQIVKCSQDILGDNLVGECLCSSAIMGCFNNKISDIDLLVVINNDMSDKEKSQYINMIVKLNDFVLN